MTDFPGYTSGSIESLASDFPGRVSAAFTHVRHSYTPSYLGVAALSLGFLSTDGRIAGGVVIPPPPHNNFAGHVDSLFNDGDTWFERVHVLARRYEFGNILDTIVTTIEPYNAYRTATRTLQAITNNAGDGLTFPDMPTLPIAVPPQSSLLADPTISFSPGPPTLDTVGLLEMRITTDGVATFDTTLDFVWDLGVSVVEVSGIRLAFLPIEYDAVKEHLEWATNVISRRNGSEQRKSYRIHPRQAFRVRKILDERDRRELHSILFDWQPRTFGLPLWHEAIATTAAVSIGATVVSVISTNYIDFRVGKLAVVFTDARTYDVLEVSAVGATSVTFLTPTSNAHAAGVRVMPVRLVETVPIISGQRYPVTVETWEPEFICVDNEVTGLADVSAFSTYNGKVFLDDSNLLRGTSPHSYFRAIRRMDNESGVPTQTSTWDRSKRGHQKTFHARTRQALWNLRRLMYALRGKQVSFYIPTFIEDVRVIEPIAAATDQLTIELIGYARFVRSRSPRDTIRVTFTDGTKLIRVVTDAVEDSTTEETLTVDSNWPDNRAVAEIVRVEFIELVRIDTDDIQIEHEGVGRARCTVPVQALLETLV